MEERGMSQAQLGRRVTKRLADPDRGLDSTQIRLVIQGRRRLDEALVEAFIDVLGLDPYAAWEAALDTAGLKPPGFTAEGYRSFVLAGQAGASGHAAFPSTGSNPRTFHNWQSPRGLRRLTQPPLRIAA